MTPWTAAHQASLSFTISQSLLKLMSMSQRCHLTISSSVIPLSSCPQSFPAAGSFPLSWLFASKCRSKVFSNESTLPIRRPKFWSFSFSISPSSEYSGLISFRINWFDLLAVQGILKSLLQYHSSKTSVLQQSAFSIVQLSHLYMITGKTITLTIRTFVSKGMSLLFNIPSSLS